MIKCVKILSIWQEFLRNMKFYERIKEVRMRISFRKYIFLFFGFETKFLIQTSSLTRESYGQDGSDTNLSTPGFLIPDACYAIHRNPRITIFTRHNILDITVHHPLQTIIKVLQINDLMIQS